MRNHNDLLNMNERSLEQQAAVRRATFSPGEIKAPRPFSIWEISQFMFDAPADTLRKKLAEMAQLLGGPDLEISVEVHGDDRVTVPLTQKRAEAVRSLLVRGSSPA